MALSLNSSKSISCPRTTALSSSLRLRMVSVLSSFVRRKFTLTSYRIQSRITNRNSNINSCQAPSVTRISCPTLTTRRSPTSPRKSLLTSTIAYRHSLTTMLYLGFHCNSSFISQHVSQSTDQTLCQTALASRTR